MHDRLPPELRDLLNRLEPGLYTASARIEGLPEHDLLSDALRDALGRSSRATYRDLVDRYLETVNAPLVLQASDAFQLNQHALRALHRLAEHVPVLILNRGHLPTDHRDLTRELAEIPGAHVDAVFDHGDTVTLVRDPQTLLRALATAGIALMILRATTDNTADFWVLTTLGLAGLAASKLG